MYTGVRWTNESVLQLAGSADPIAIVERRARDLVLRAIDEGWSGPPFSQIKLANLAGIAVEANGAVQDAQTVATEAGDLLIRYNPTQVRERVRFSIAHEITHTFFPDCAEKIRNRGGDENVSDDWQLEMLCNIGAAELSMPLGSISQEGAVRRLEELLVERRRFDVSAEAYLIRVAKTAHEPIIMFAASPRVVSGKTEYRIDYCVPSPTWSGPRLASGRGDEDSLIAQCKSIGFTAHGEEHWDEVGLVYVEAVGIPAYPGGRMPRVVGLVRSGTQRHSTTYDVIQGDLLSSNNITPRIVCQLVNDQARTWGGGVARASASKWPAAQAAFSEWLAGTPKELRLGNVHFWEDSPVVLASLVAQRGFRPASEPLIRYSALNSCLHKVANKALALRLPVFMPRLGTGLAGGSWDIVEQLVQETLITKSISVTIVDLPPKRQSELAL